MYCDPLALCTVTFGFPNSKKNIFFGNYMKKYGTYCNHLFLNSAQLASWDKLKNVQNLHKSM